MAVLGGSQHMCPVEAARVGEVSPAGGGLPGGGVGSHAKGREGTVRGLASWLIPCVALRLNLLSFPSVCLLSLKFHGRKPKG